MALWTPHEVFTVNPKLNKPQFHQQWFKLQSCFNQKMGFLTLGLHNTVDHTIPQLAATPNSFMAGLFGSWRSG